MYAALTLLLSAAAGVPVVHDDDGNAAVAQVAQRVGVEEATLDAVHVNTLLAARPSALGEATLRHCAGESTRRDEIRAAVVRAEAAWREGDAPRALDHLDRGVVRLGCMAERVEPAVAARLFLLRGGLFAWDQRPEEALAELRTALSLNPEATWDDTFPSEGAPMLAGLKADGTRATVALAPAATAAGPWVDGALPPDGATELALRPGLHLVQVLTKGAVQSAWLTVRGDGALVVPRAFKPNALQAVAQDDSAARKPVERLLQASFAEQPAAYVSHAGGLWMVRIERTPETQQLVSPPPPPDPDPEPKGLFGRKKK